MSQPILKGPNAPYRCTKGINGVFTYRNGNRACSADEFFANNPHLNRENIHKVCMTKAEKMRYGQKILGGFSKSEAMEASSHGSSFYDLPSDKVDRTLLDNCNTDLNSLRIRYEQAAEQLRIYALQIEEAQARHDSSVSMMEKMAREKEDLLNAANKMEARAMNCEEKMLQLERELDIARKSAKIDHVVQHAKQNLQRVGIPPAPPLPIPMAPPLAPPMAPQARLPQDDIYAVQRQNLMASLMGAKGKLKSANISRDDDEDQESESKESAFITALKKRQAAKSSGTDAKKKQECIDQKMHYHPERGCQPCDKYLAYSEWDEEKKDCFRPSNWKDIAQKVKEGKQAPSAEYEQKKPLGLEVNATLKSFLDRRQVALNPDTDDEFSYYYF